MLAGGCEGDYRVGTRVLWVWYRGEKKIETLKKKNTWLTQTFGLPIQTISLRYLQPLSQIMNVSLFTVFCVIYYIFVSFVIRFP